MKKQKKNKKRVSDKEYRTALRILDNQYSSWAAKQAANKVANAWAAETHAYKTDIKTVLEQGEYSPE